MKITHLKLKNIKCFKEVSIPFEDSSGPIHWSLIAGNNGQGKTTLLRSVALGLCDAPGASGLILELHEGILRKGEDSGFIEITLKDTDNKKYTIKTTITLKIKSESVSQEILDDKNNPLTQGIENKFRENLFVVGYGAGRAVAGSKSYEEYALIDTVVSLFNYETNLQNTELGIRRIKQSVPKKDFELLKNSLKKILMLDKQDEIILNGKGLYVKNHKWGERSFNTLSDGYQSLTTVIMDFLHWQLQHDSSKFSLAKTGIFIIDEIEQHLHPKWQKQILRILSEQFPNIQFIATTHTPICVLGLNDLECESQLIKASYQEKNHSESDYSKVSLFDDMKESYKGYRVDQILVSNIFDLTSSRSQNIEEKLEKYREIYLKDATNRTKGEKQQMQAIEKELENLPMWDTLEDKKTRKELKELLEKQQEKKA